MIEFQSFPKIARLSREVLVTEKIDGTNAQICITDEGEFLVGSRSRWLSAGQDNHGFFAWATNHEDELRAGLGVGRHFGEWWGSGIQRGYGLTNGEKRFSLFNVIRWTEKETPPACCSIVPLLWRGNFEDVDVDLILGNLQENGSHASPGFMKPEGVIVYHIAGNVAFKKTLEKDQEHKGQ